MTQFVFSEPLYNKSLIEATKSKANLLEETYIPVISTDIRIILKWIDKDENNIGYVSIYPNPTGDVEIKTGTTDENILYNDVLYQSFVTAEKKQTRNFLKQIKIERIMTEGGNKVDIVLYDPLGKLLDESMIKPYIEQYKEGSNVHMNLVYGWGNTDLDLYGASLGDDLILLSLSVDVEYFGASYTFSFIDSTSNKFNRNINSWQLLPSDTTNPQNNSNNEITFPEALIEAWRLQHKANADTFGLNGKIYLLASQKESFILPKYVYEGNPGTIWKGKKKAFADWNPGDKLFKDWIISNLRTDDPGYNNTKYTFNLFGSKTRIPGDPRDYWLFDGTQWQPLTAVCDIDSLRVTKNSFKVPNNKAFCAIIVDVLESAAASENLLSKQEVLKYFLYATPIRSPHATVINFKVKSDNILKLYLARPTMINTPKEHVPETDKPKDFPHTTGTVTISAPDNSAACQPSSKQDDPANPKGTTKEETAQSMSAVEKTSFLTLKAELDILGDPDLCTNVYTFVAIGTDNYTPALLDWVTGIYLVERISENLDEGMWLMSLSLTKMAELPPELAHIKNNLISFPNSIDVNIISQPKISQFFQITNYFQWLADALGLGVILENLINNIISDLSSIYSGIINLFSNEELATIINTIQNTLGGKNYNKYQNLNYNTSPNLIQQAYQIQIQVSKEILNNYFENFSKLSTIENIETRKQLSLLATKFGGDLVRGQIKKMMSNNEEISFELVKNRLSEKVKWYQTGDKNLAINIKNFKIKNLK